jgi:hypothetical protein
MTSRALAKQEPIYHDEAELQALVMQAWFIASMHQVQGSASRILTEGLRWVEAERSGKQSDSERAFKLLVRMFLEDHLPRIRQSGGSFISEQVIDTLKRLTGMEVR